MERGDNYLDTFLAAISNTITTNVLINHEKTTMFEFFTAVSYPALCLQPSKDIEVLSNELNFSYEESLFCSAYYVEDATQNDSMDNFLQKVNLIKESLKNNPQLNGTCNAGFTIKIIFQAGTTETNNEFIAELQIEGRRL